MRSRESAYALVRRGAVSGARGAVSGAEVLLEQRSAGASLMPGMWELPAIDAESAPEEKKALMVRHSITDTNYSVTIYDVGARRPRGLRKGAVRRWFAVSELHTVPLTGLARKVLKRVRAWRGFDRAATDRLARKSGLRKQIGQKFT
jgi:A/G-specific adenine glycosylase